MSFNHFRIKREAHHLSRQNTNASFNPFAHISWGRNRRYPFPQGRDLEAGDNVNTDDDDQPGSPMTQSQTAPASHLQSSGALPDAGDSAGQGAKLEQRAEHDTSDAILVSAGDSQCTADQADLKNRGRHYTMSEQEESPPEIKAEKPLSFRLFSWHYQLPPCFGLLYTHVEPKEHFTIANQIQRTVLGAWVNLLLICTPVGFALNYSIGKSVLTFIVNLVALIPLLGLNDDALVEISYRIGEHIGGLIYIFTSNLVQLITCVLLIMNHQGSLVQLTIVGGILANLLFILGIAILCGSMRRPYQHFHPPAAHVSSNLLSLSATSLLIPTTSRLLSQATPENLIKQSRVASFILILVYFLYLLYQLVTHKDEFDIQVQRVERKPFRPRLPPHAIKRGFANPVGVLAHGVPKNVNQAVSNLLTKGPLPADEDDKGPELHFFVAIAVFTLTTVLLYFCVEFAVSSIDSVISRTDVSQNFIGLILLPLPNCDFTAITTAIEDKMNNTLNSTIGKCLQTALFVTPLAVLIAWSVGEDDVTLVFDGFEIVSLFAAILLLNFLMTKGEVRWIQGALLLADWGLIACAAFYAGS